jgi:predicted metal-dependent enzyme (double-stranded beta helix superfamily)
MLDALRSFVQSFTRLVETEQDGVSVLAQGGPLLRELISEDGWLPDAYAEPDVAGYRQYLLHCDPLERFSVVSFVWGPGQRTPIHDHRVWGLVGVLRGAEISTPYRRRLDGSLEAMPGVRLAAGEVEQIAPAEGDIHHVENARADGASVSIHVYGANIGAIRRAVYDPLTGDQSLFISGYSNHAVPNLWNRSHEALA